MHGYIGIGRESQDGPLTAPTRLIYVQSDIPEGMTVREWRGLRAPRRTVWQRLRAWLHAR